jgi:thermitase
MRILALLPAALTSAAVASSAQAAEPSPDALIVELRERADLVRAGEVPGLARVDVVEPADGDRARALSELLADPEVRWAEPVLPRSAAADARVAQQWGLENTGQWLRGTAGLVDADIDAFDAWAVTRGAGVTIAVVDSGVASAHPDLAPKLTGNPGERGAGRENNRKDDDGNGLVDDWHGWDFVGDDNLAEDADGHGTHVAGTAAAAAGGGEVVGVAPESGLLALRALLNGSGSTAHTTAAFSYAGKLGVRVVNASLAGTGDPSKAERAAIHAYPNTLFVVAAGNHDEDDAKSAGNGDEDAAKTYPCAYDEPNVLCVAASTNRDGAAGFSNVSATAVDLFAPGEDIYSSYPPSLYGYMSGTSAATPHAAGAAALVASAHPDWTPGRIKQALMDSADRRPELAGKAVTGARLNAAAAVSWAPPDAPAPAPAPRAAPPASPSSGLSPKKRAPVVSRLRLVGRPRTRAAALVFTASASGRVRLVAERRVGRRYKRAGAGSLVVAAGRQRTRLGTRIAGARLKRGTWRVTVGSARITFRVR